MNNFSDLCRVYGLMIDSPIQDGRWHRVRTEDKPHKRNGAYIWDGYKGAVRNWATMEDFAIFRSEETDRRDFTKVRQQQREQRQKEAWRQARAAQTAHSMIAEAKRLVPTNGVPGRPAVAAHPYLVRKGFPLQEALVWKGLLLVPMYSLEGELVGAQTIDDAGKKLFLPGTRAKGAVARLGMAKETWLVEGYATGLAVRRGLQRLYRNACVMVCFSAGNLTHVAGQMPAETVFIVADNDASKTGEKAAVAADRPWCMPPAEGMDANDFLMSQGEDALAQMLMEVVR